jgi:hypothetical protein
VFGITMRRKDEHMPSGAIAGLADGQHVVAIPYGDLMALATAVPLEEFAPERVQVLVKDASWLEHLVREHQRVVEELHNQNTTAPVQFCSVFANEDDLRASLAKDSTSLLRILRELEECDEFEVLLSIEQTLLQEHLRSSVPGIMALVEARKNAPAGRAYLLERRMSGLLERSLGEVVEDLAAEAFHELRMHATAGQTLPLAHVPAHDNGAIMRPCLRAAYLVKHAQRLDFMASLERVATLRPELRTEYRGPLPPYDFIDVAGGAELAGALG